MKKFLFVQLAVAVFALVPSIASATQPLPPGVLQCRVLTFGNGQTFGTTCNNPPGVLEPQNLRENNDGLGTNPLSTNFGTDMLAVNTKGPLRFKVGAGAGEAATVPMGYGFFVFKLFTNPESSKTICRQAQGNIPAADIQHASNSAVFNGSSGAWTFSIKSDNEGCPLAEKGKVTIRNVSLLFETLKVGGTPIVAAGAIAGAYENPDANCPAGGIKLNISQSGLMIEPTFASPEIDNGAGGSAYICFVSANNYLFSEVEPKWTFTQGKGIWKN